MDFTSSIMWIFFQSVQWHLNTCIYIYTFKNITDYFICMTEKNTSVCFSPIQVYLAVDTDFSISCRYWFFYQCQRYIAELIIAPISDYMFGCWGLVFNKKADMGLIFTLCRNDCENLYQNPWHIKRASKWVLLLPLGFYTVVFFEVTQCINGGDTARGVRKMRTYGIISPNDIKVCNDQVYQNSAVFVYYTI